MHMTAFFIALTLLAQHGHAGMPFDQDKAVHHFLLAKDGGTIAVDANDPADRATLGAVRMHLRHISQAFAHGDFGAPFATHGEIPPGVPVMQRLKKSISYSYEDTASGGRVLLKTRNADALSAIQAFLRYQIREHKTGDPR